MTRLFGWTFTDYGPAYCEFSDGRLTGGFAKGTLNPGGPLVILYAHDLAATQRRLEDAGAKSSAPRRLSETFAKPPARREAEVTANFDGVHFEMMDDLNERVRCFHTRAGFEKIVGADHFTEDELRRLFTVHREALERLASALYEAPASYTT